jgi:hypothetical protein
MTFIDFINTYVEDEDFKSTINSLHNVWLKTEKQSQFESAVTIQSQQTGSTANSTEQNTAAQQEQKPTEPRTIQGDLNNMDSQKVLSLAARFQEIEKQKEENAKAAQEAQAKLDGELDDLQQNFNAVVNGKTDNIVG